MRKTSYEYRHYNHSVGLAVVHLVWIPKRRRKVLVGDVKTRLVQIFQELAIEKDWITRQQEMFLRTQFNDISTIRIMGKLRVG